MSVDTPTLSGNPAPPPRKSGVLSVRVVEARGLVHPSGSQLASRYAPYHSEASRLPYVVIEFEKNEVVVNALGGDASSPLWKYNAPFDVSRVSEIMISIYQRTLPTQYQDANARQNAAAQLPPNTFGVRNPPPTTPAGGNSSTSASPGSDAGAILLGFIKISPEFLDKKFVDNWYPLYNGSGHIRVQYCYQRRESGPLTIDAFDLLTVIGKGSFGKVMQVRKKDTDRIYAMKILKKSKIVMRSEVQHTLAERTVLAQINHPFIVPLKFSFQTPEKLYLVLAFINGGELFHHLQREGRFDEHRSRFYAAELLSALECLHSYNVVYRDLKPENILLDYKGHIALCDFGLCKLNMTENERTNTFCGTPEYLAPELLYGQGYTKTVDWWTFGVLLYEMLTGLPPFYDENTNEMYRRILEDELRFPEDMSMRARHLLRGLLTRDPNQRLGHSGAHEIKSQPFFGEIDWSMLLAKKYDPPFKPSVVSSVDTSNFDEEFTSEIPIDSLADETHLSATAQEQFVGFTYEGDGGAMSLARSIGPAGFGRSMGGMNG
ncbi:putative Serine/threonine-protein kinase gad8 [Dimargaris cristalligena]|uniref:non-specific serine/threonine protein kinase n=1 Tax=Dimargaris cristalligena TaxID=215637 RepID=A0A4P9ZQR6_9FUNG|nr:putative Serine/threonine-protein kinase gad8 [Dimargaris cristalligena]|eukprot:RKP35836.1 putative Serine/threonine-protein kinase gad8 [Dimargaris cristalligena]